MSKIKRHIGIIGAGFSGLATAWYLSKAGHQVTIYESSPLGENASGISAGLLHPYTGYKAAKSRNGEAKIKATLELLTVATNALGEPVHEKTGLLRPALKEDQEIFFKDCSDQNSDVHWMSAKEVQDKFPGIHALPAIWIDSAIQVNTKYYLQGLWKACEKSGVQWICEPVTSARSLKEDIKIIATGSQTLPESRHLPVHPVKGQLLELSWDNPLPFPISSGVYLVPGTVGHSVLVGATFEHHFYNAEPNIQLAQELLLPKLKKLYSLPDPVTVLSCKVGIRASTPTRKPIIQQVDDRIWTIVGMGSKGLLYHAESARQLSLNLNL